MSPPIRATQAVALAVAAGEYFRLHGCLPEWAVTPVKAAA